MTSFLPQSNRARQLWSSQDISQSSKEDGSLDGLLHESPFEPSTPKKRRWPLAVSLAANVILLIIIALLARQKTDPSLATYSPANSVIEYYTTNITTGFMTQTAYMGYPDNETDRLWEDLYQFGNSIVSEEDAKRLPYPTMPVMGTNDYLVQLEVFHQLHCLNDIRKAFYPERYPGKWRYDDDGTINRKNMQWRHWDHCLDILRQTIMCNADVSPLSWRLNEPVGKVLAPQLETTHTCRNFSKVVEWARTHEAKDLRTALTEEEIRSIRENPPFEQTAWEDLSSFWKMFPGNKYFKQWRENVTVDG